MKVIITSPSLNINQNVSGISSVTKFIIDKDHSNDYLVFELGKKDDEKRNIFWFFRIVKIYARWCYWMLFKWNALIHFNIALAKRSIIRDSPLILIAKLLRKKMIIHLHGGEYLTDKQMPPWMKYLLRLCFSGKNPVVVLSPIEQVALREKLNASNLFVLFSCVDLNEAKVFIRKFKKDEMIRLLFLGRISIYKGIELIYQALKVLKQKGVRFKFTMAGRGPEEESYVEKFTMLLHDDFEFKGVVSGDRKTKILQENNVFLLPSFFEGMPVALLESMSFGLVPITTNVGSIKHVITHDKNGIFVKLFSSEEIVYAVERLAKDKAYKNKLSINARNHIFNNFKPEEYIVHLNEIYNYEQNN